MGKRDERVDQYIDKAADFAQPILRHLRELVHENCPEVEETMKWKSPFFMHHGILCNMASFKQHCAFGFWRSGSKVLGDSDAAGQAMGNLGRITSLEELPPDPVMAGYIREAMRLNEAGPAARSAPAAESRQELPVPDDLSRALQSNPAALQSFDRFSPSQRRDYIEWITEAKRQPTRERRLVTTLEWLAEGKPRHWKYQKR